MVALATPVDFRHLGPLASMLRTEQLDPGLLLDETGNVPASTLLQAFRINEPTGDVATYLSLWNSLADPDRLAAHYAMVGWSSGHIPFPGAAFRQITELFVRDSALLRGRVPLGAREVDLHTIDLPVLVVEGERDSLVPSGSTAPIDRVLLGARLEHLRVDAGHAGLLVGRTAHTVVMPALLAWLNREAPGEAAI